MVNIPNDAPQMTADIVDYLRVIINRKTFILKTTVAAFVVAVAVSLLLPKTYQATARFMPPSQDQSLLGAVLGQGGAGGVAGLASDILGGGTNSDMYAGMLNSDTIKDALIDRFKLMNVYGKKYRVDTYNELAKRMMVEVGKKDGIVSVTVEARDPRLAADLANASVDELGKLSVKLNVTGAGQNLSFLEERLTKAKADLARAEDAMKAFQTKNKTLDITAQVKGTIEGVAALKAQLAVQETQLAIVQGQSTEFNHDVKSLKTSIASLKRQIAKLEGGDGSGAIPALGSVPSLGEQHVRLLRDLKIQEALVEFLTKQYEFSRFTAAKNVPGIQIIQSARVPDKKVKPKRTLLVLVVTGAGLLYSLAMSFMLEHINKMSIDNKARWCALLAELNPFRKVHRV